MASTKVEDYLATRITVTSNHTYDEVERRLYADIGKAPENSWPAIIASIKPNDCDDFTKTIQRQLGPHGFMIFYEFDHGIWMPFFGVGDNLRNKRILLGNPLFAITMLRHDYKAGLSVPVELLLMENADRKSTTLVYQLPSALIARINTDAELVKAASTLDGKFEKLVHDIAS